MQTQMWILPSNNRIFSLFTTQTQHIFHVQCKYIIIINTFEELKVSKVKFEPKAWVFEDLGIQQPTVFPTSKICPF